MPDHSAAVRPSCLLLHLRTTLWTSVPEVNAVSYRGGGGDCAQGPRSNLIITLAPLATPDQEPAPLVHVQSSAYPLSATTLL